MTVTLFQPMLPGHQPLRPGRVSVRAAEGRARQPEVPHHGEPRREQQACSEPHPAVEEGQGILLSIITVYIEK